MINPDDKDQQGNNASQSGAGIGDTAEDRLRVREQQSCGDGPCGIEAKDLTVIFASNEIITFILRDVQMVVGHFFSWGRLDLLSLITFRPLCF